MSTPFRMISADKFPTRYEAFEHQGEWCILEIADDSPCVHYTELAVYSNRSNDTHAEVRRLVAPIEGRSFAAEVYRNGRGYTLPARDFGHAISLAADWLGLP